MNLWLRRFARISAWALLATVVVLVVSGWGITQTGVIYSMTFGLVDRRSADAIHRATNVPLAAFFLLHVLINIGLGVKTSNRMAAWAISGVIILVGVATMSLVVYLEYFRLGG